MATLAAGPEFPPLGTKIISRRRFDASKTKDPFSAETKFAAPPAPRSVAGRSDRCAHFARSVASRVASPLTRSASHSVVSVSFYPDLLLQQINKKSMQKQFAETVNACISKLADNGGDEAIPKIKSKVPGFCI